MSSQRHFVFFNFAIVKRSSIRLLVHPSVGPSVCQELQLRLFWPLSLNPLPRPPLIPNLPVLLSSLHPPIPRIRDDIWTPGFFFVCFGFSFLHFGGKKKRVCLGRSSNFWASWRENTKWDLMEGNFRSTKAGKKWMEIQGVSSQLQHKESTYLWF